MSEPLPQIFLARHGETAWTISGQHTGLTDIPLTERGEQNARSLGIRLKGLEFAKVLMSPLQRAQKTCELAGFAPHAEIDPDLVEWNYGKYEGQRTDAIRQKRPDWNIFRDGCPDGETPEAIGTRADRVIGRLRAGAGDVLLFAHQDFLRVLAIRWVQLSVIEAQHLLLTTASLSIVGYDRALTEPVIRLWNDDRHVMDESRAPQI